MKAFFVKYRRLLLLIVLFFIYILYSTAVNSIPADTSFFSTKTLLDSNMPFLDFTVYGYILWIILFALSLLYLFSSLGDGYYRLITSLSLSVIICIIIYINFPVKMDIPDFENSVLFNRILCNAGIASFPNLPACILFNSFFFILFNKKKHDHSKITTIAVILVSILLLWVACAMFSKTAYILDLSSGLLIGIISSVLISFIPFKHTH